MLKDVELRDSRDKLSQAHSLVEAVRVQYLLSGYVEGGRLLLDVLNLISDEIAALDKCVQQTWNPRP